MLNFKFLLKLFFNIAITGIYIYIFNRKMQNNNNNTINNV